MKLTAIFLLIAFAFIGVNGRAEDACAELFTTEYRQQQIRVVTQDFLRRALQTLQVSGFEDLPLVNQRQVSAEIAGWRTHVNRDKRRKYLLFLSQGKLELVNVKSLAPRPKVQPPKPFKYFKDL